jgi:hypothetical protein
LFARILSVSFTYKCNFVVHGCLHGNCLKTSLLPLKAQWVRVSPTSCIRSGVRDKAQICLVGVYTWSLCAVVHGARPLRWDGHRHGLLLVTQLGCSGASPGWFQRWYPCHFPELCQLPCLIFSIINICTK